MVVSSVVLRGMELGNVLDVGTGYGTFIQTLIGCGAVFDSVIGIDSNLRAIEGAREQVDGHEGRITFCQMDSEALDYQDEQFDTVSIGNTLHHLSHPDIVLLEMLRVLKRGGRFIISEMISDGLPADQQVYRDLHHLLGDLDMMSGKTHRHTPSRSEVQRVCADIGLVDIKEMFMEYPDPLTTEQLDQLLQFVAARIENVADPEQRKEFNDRSKTIIQAIGTHGIHIPVSLIIVEIRPTRG